MKPIVKIPRSLLEIALTDLERPHAFAAERLGFISFRQSVDPEFPMLLCHEYHSVPDDQYIVDPSCGGRINGDAIRAAMGRTFQTNSGQLWVHTHGRRGVPGASRTDRTEGPRVAQSCANAQPRVMQGWAILSEDGIAGQVRSLGGELHELTDLRIVGWPTKVGSYRPTERRRRRFWIWRSKQYEGGDRYDRQSFLGADSQKVIESAKIGIVGLGGGGSHISQQAAHIGFQRVVMCDPQSVEDTNLNRLIGATTDDARRARLKVDIAARLYRGLQPDAEIEDTPTSWEDKRGSLRDCDLIFGAIDGFGARRDLEAFCRRHIIPLIDVGMIVLRPDSGLPEIRGQVILSMPGECCMHCIAFLTEENLGNEAQDYGAGIQPQVVWPNGILASTAIGLGVQLLTGWSAHQVPCCRLDYTGSRGWMRDSNIANAVKPHPCRHYPLNQCGDPVFNAL